MQAKRGFTLVEILIVVVILGILAAIVIPQFTQASTEAKTNSLCSDLQTLRSQIELYKVQHNDVAPGNPALADFTPQMTQTSNAAGDGVRGQGPDRPHEPGTVSGAAFRRTRSTTWTPLALSAQSITAWAGPTIPTRVKSVPPITPPRPISNGPM